MTTDYEGHIEIELLPDIEGFNKAMRQQDELRRVRPLTFEEFFDIGYHAVGLDQPHGPVLGDLFREPAWVAEVEQIATRAMTERPAPPTIQQTLKWSTP